MKIKRVDRLLEFHEQVGNKQESEIRLPDSVCKSKEEGRTETIPLRIILKDESRNLSNILRLPFDKKQKSEEVLEYNVAIVPLESHVRASVEISTKKMDLGCLYRENGEIVFEPEAFFSHVKFLFSRESFHEILKKSAAELENHKDHIYGDSSPEPEFPK